MDTYKITKTIRFKAEPIKAKTLQGQAKRLQNKPEPDIAPLIVNGYNIISIFEKWVFSDEERTKLRGYITVHFRWLRQYTKDDWYNWKEKQEEKELKYSGTKQPERKQQVLSNSPFATLAGLRDKFADSKAMPPVAERNMHNQNRQTQKMPEKKISLSDIPYLKNDLLIFCSNWRETLEKLNDAQNRPKDNSMRRSCIASYLNQLAKQQMLPMLIDFVANVNDKQSEKTAILLSKAILEFQKQLETAQISYLSAQSSGVLLARSSFNYYIISKKPKDFDVEEKKIKDELENKYQLHGDKIQLLRKLGIETNLSIEKLYETLKDYKAEQKSAFQEAVSQGLSFPELKTKFSLFECTEEIFNEYASKTNSIAKKSTQKNNTSKGSKQEKDLQNEINKLKRERGQMLQQKKFQKYTHLCDEYKKIAVRKGKLKAQIKGIEKERIDSQRLQYWALIAEQQGKHQLVLVPKENASQAYSEISNNRRIDGDEPTMLYYFESFTFRALRKLCFGVNGNTFLPEIKQELPLYNKPDFGEHFFIKEGVRDEAAFVKFYQCVLKTNYAKQNLNLPHEQLKVVSENIFPDLQSFKIALEKVCYTKRCEKGSYLVKKLETEYNAQFFDLTSYDLQKIDKSNLKNHTKIWNDFWDNKNEETQYPTRLNPEISIFWREPKTSRIEKYGKGTELYAPEKKNRYLHPQFTVAFTLNENALNSELNYAFEGFEKQKSAMIAFNQKINSEFKEGLEKQNLGSFGIDTGEVELATIGLTDKGNPFPVKVIRLKKDKLSYEKVGFRANGIPREKPYRAIDNLSYFIKEEQYKRTFRSDDFQKIFNELFEEIETPTIDLTCAKMICGHIVLNGDLQVRQKLNLLNAKRQIRQALILDATIKVTIDRKNQKIAIPETNERKIKKGQTEKIVYHTNTELNHIKPFNEVANEIEAYIKLVQDDSSQVLDNINRFRKVAAANMVGVIFHLYKRYPIVIAIENLAQGTMEDHRQRYEGIMDRPLERALYRKFQALGLTPPVSDVVAIREALTQKQGKISQLGVLRFVDEQHTSQTCPNCGKNAYDGDNAQFYIEEKKEEIFHCRHCGWHNKDKTMGIDGLHSNDAVASYNIAKRGMTYL